MFADQGETRAILNCPSTCKNFSICGQYDAMNKHKNSEDSGKEERGSRVFCHPYFLEEKQTVTV